MAPFLPSVTSSSSFTCERRPADSTTADHPDTPTPPKSFKFTVPVPTKAGGDKKAPLRISLFDTYEKESDKRTETDVFSLLESSLISNQHKPLSPPPISPEDTEVDLLPVAKRSRPDHEVKCASTVITITSY